MKPDRGASGARTRGRRVTVEFDLDRATWVVVGVTLLIAVLQILTGYLRFKGHQSRFMALLGYFDTNADMTFNAWFASLIIAAAGIGALVASTQTDRSERRGFIALAMVLLYLSLDKATSLTEFIADQMPRFIDVGDPKWTVIGLSMLVAAVVYLIWWLLRLPAPPRSGLLLGGSVFLFGALMLNSFSGLVSGDSSNWAPSPLSVLEEVAEIVGLVLVARTLMLVVQDGNEEFSLKDVTGR